MYNIPLRKYHVLRCPYCGELRTSTTKTRACCLKCAHGWQISQGGQTIGVLASFWLPAEARLYVQKLKEERWQKREERLSLIDAFAFFGLSTDCDKDKFIEQYRKKALLYHPDANGGDKLKEALFVKMSLAAQKIRCSMGW